MKTTLPENSQSHQDRLEDIVEIIKKKGGTKISYIILFGSYARGESIDDIRIEPDGSTSSYNSDYDILIITTGHKSVIGTGATNLKFKIVKEVKKRGLLANTNYRHRVLSLIIEPLSFINKSLRKGQYFFHEIKRDGILLYKADNVKELEEAKELSNEERRKTAEDYFDEWFKYAEEFFKTYNFLFSEKSYKLAAFNLHQTTENLLSCSHLVFTNYRPRTHNLEELIHNITPYFKEVRNIFPIDDKEAQNHLELLNAAYVGRYEKDYIISKEELEYLANNLQ